MISIVVFHVLMALLGLGIWSRAVPEQLVSAMLGYLHSTIGITPPPLEKVRMIALIWIGSTIVIVDGSLLLLMLITKLSYSG
ncbi:MAG: hypothetical protein WA383_15415 [Terriglobales bacterium]|jgi:hypothetical protein